MHARSNAAATSCDLRSPASPRPASCSAMVCSPGRPLSMYFACSRSCSMKRRRSPARCASRAFSGESKTSRSTVLAAIDERRIADQRLRPAPDLHDLGQLAERPAGESAHAPRPRRRLARTARPPSRPARRGAARDCAPSRAGGRARPRRGSSSRDVPGSVSGRNASSGTARFRALGHGARSPARAASRRRHGRDELGGELGERAELMAHLLRQRFREQLNLVLQQARAPATRSAPRSPGSARSAARSSSRRRAGRRDRGGTRARSVRPENSS